MNYIHRRVEALLKRYLTIFPSVLITGPRQSGKSTLVKTVLSDFDYVTFDILEEIEAFKQDPRKFFLRFKRPVVFDEIQRVPDLLFRIKIEIDENRDAKGRFVLTGSDQLLLRKNMSETLAGRVGLLTLLPFERSEIPGTERESQILFGSFPELVMAKYNGAKEWFSSYLGTYIEKDIRMAYEIDKLSDFQTLVRLLAARNGQELNSSSLAREIGVSVNTIDAWISILEAGYIVFKLRPFHANVGKRLIKRPKVYFYDTGLACHLAGIRDMETLENGPLGGAIFENLIISEAKKKALHSGKDLAFMFYRDNTGNEADLAIHDREHNHIDVLEIKSGFTPKADWRPSIDKVASICFKAQDYSNASISTGIIYRGQSLHNWPGEDFNFYNYEDWILNYY